MSAFYPFGYFPFRVVEKDQHGDPLELWDGTTYGPNLDEEEFEIRDPSKSSTEYILVAGPGTAYPMGFTLEELSEIYWRISILKVTLNYNYYLSLSTESVTLTVNRTIASTAPLIRRSIYAEAEDPGSFGLIETYESTPQGHLSLVTGGQGITGESLFYKTTSGPITFDYSSITFDRAEGEFYDEEELRALLSASFEGTQTIDSSTTDEALGDFSYSGGFGFFCLKVGDLYYPRFGFSISPGIDGGGDAQIWSRQFQENYPPEFPDLHTRTFLTNLTFKIRDKTWTFPVYMDTEGYFGGFWDPSYITLTVTIEPVQWFSWDGTYNESTGEPV
jgi:hypothetical protein